jgi:hypothetical protein
MDGLTQMKARRIRVYAVKVDGEGWLGVADDVGRCHGHGHETPELAKLCALHRQGTPPGGGNMVLMPVAASRGSERRIAKASG